MIKNSSNIHYLLLSFGRSETNLQSRASSSQSTLSLKPPTAEDVLEDQQDSVHNEASSGAKSSETDHSNSSLKVPLREISSSYNSLRHTGGTDYQFTSSMAEAKALEVSLSIPDHSEGTVSDDPSTFAKQQHEVDGYFSPNENEMDNSLTTEDKHASSFHSDEEQHLLDDAEGSECKLKGTKMLYERLRFEKKLSAGQLV